MLHVILAKTGKQLAPGPIIAEAGFFRGRLSLGSRVNRDFSSIFRIDFPGDVILFFQGVQYVGYGRLGDMQFFLDFRHIEIGSAAFAAGAVFRRIVAARNCSLSLSSIQKLLKK